ncbi:hypothetical protein OG552_00270 [Streptomyces sp. NBC_01476]|uniref:hypothetical protein n=1 Tax=Streptomyces sp. NBC_01476 TaxID=2903881 RepID=UPI002E37C6AA|nr:hypothetical protein [Streptomyces sp. NBC_01476]
MSEGSAADSPPGVGGELTVFGLPTGETDRERPRLRARAAASTEKAVRTLGFTPSLRMEGRTGTDVPRAIADDAAAVVELSNVARHAHASGVHRGGLRDLAERAHCHGGNLTVGPGGKGGTRGEGKAPLPPGDDGGGRR